ncbi:RHS repeat protein, partial [Salmonella enterica subsp. enterica serovar Mbandaka]|nr:RHS repeat protein [Salmonella enterica subsp. enterica serovar Mbandaka]
AVINPDESTGLVYSYDSLGNITLVEPASYTSSGVASVTNAESAAYTYENGRLSTIVTGSSTYSFTYDVFGNNTGIDVGDRNLTDYTYNARNGKLAKITYGNGFVVNYVYDELDRVKSISYNGTVAYQYEYDANGNLCKLIDKTSGRTYQYKYDDQGRLTGFYESVSGTNTTSATNVYDEQSRLHMVSYSKD